MPLTWGEMTSFASLGIAGTLLVLNFLDRKRAQIRSLRDELKEVRQVFEAEVDKLVQKLNSTHADTEVLKAQVSVFWRGVAFNGSMALHSPHTPAFDELAEKFTADMLQPNEFAIYRDMLISIARDHSEDKLRRYIAQEVIIAIYVQTSHSIFLAMREEEVAFLQDLVDLWYTSYRRGAGG